MKDPVKGMNRQDTDQDKILEHNIYIEELVFRRCKAFSKVKVKIQKAHDSTTTWTKT